MRSLRPRLLVLALTAALAPNAFAQAAPADDKVTQLTKVTVSASTARLPEGEGALPNTITVITREELEQQLALTSDISQIIANLVPAFAPSRQKLSSRGESLRGRRPLYMVDGVPQSTPLRDGSRDAHTIDPAMIERIEIIHGANALQGLGASGGIINFITKRAPAEGGVFFETSLSASAAVPRQSDDASYRGSFLMGARKGDFDFVGGVAYDSQGLYRDGEGRAIAVNTVQGDIMDSDANDVFLKFGWSLPRDQRLQLSLNRYALEGNGDYVSVNGNFATGVPATSVRGRAQLDPARNLAESVALDYTAPDLFGGSFQAQVFWMDFMSRFGESQFSNFTGPGTPSRLEQSQNVSKKRGVRLTQSWRNLGGLPLHLTAGLDALSDTTYQELLVSGLDWVPETEYRSLSPFVQAQWWLFGGRVMLAGGLRYENAELKVGDYTTIPSTGAHFVEGGTPDMSETLPNFGAVWYITGDLNAYASYAEGYSVADVGRVLRAVNQPGQRVEDLVDIRPVIADNREIGLEYDNGRFDANLAYYRSQSDLGSLLIFDPVNGVYNVQRQATEITGWEARAAVRFGERSRVGLGYARADGRYDRDQDGRLDTDLEGVNIAPNRLTAFWEQGWGDAFSTRLQASHAYDRAFDRNGAQVADFQGYTVVDLFARIPLPVGTLNVGVENLLDEQYISYYSQTTPSNADYTAGRGRVLTVGWSHRF